MNMTMTLQNTNKTPPLLPQIKENLAAWQQNLYEGQTPLKIKESYFTQTSYQNLDFETKLRLTF